MDGCTQGYLKFYITLRSYVKKSVLKLAKRLNKKRMYRTSSLEIIFYEWGISMKT